MEDQVFEFMFYAALVWGAAVAIYLVHEWWTEWRPRK